LVVFQLRYHTVFGQELFITGNHSIFGNNDITKALPMRYLNNEWWSVSVNFTDINVAEPIVYNYVLRNADGSYSYDWGSDKQLDLSVFSTKEILIKDSWNYAGFQENAFYTEPFKKVLLKHTTSTETEPSKKATHLFKIKAPVLNEHELLCISGATTSLKNWDTKHPLFMQKRRMKTFSVCRLI